MARARQTLFWDTRGLVEVNLNDDRFTYTMVAKTAHDRTTVTLVKNEAGFRGRQWETSPAINDGQHPSIRAAAFELLGVSFERSQLRAKARELGLVP